MHGFVPATEAYLAGPPEPHHAALPIDLVSTAEIAPPHRNVTLDAHGFSRDRLIRVLEGIRTGEPIPPVLIEEPPGPLSHRYAMVDGFHRFYASVAVGFRLLPCAIRPVTRSEYETFVLATGRPRPWLWLR